MTPYLSIVVTTRNDDHGGNLLRRTQTFLTGLAAQAKRHSVPVELIIVEWNPPDGRPPLAETLFWPSCSEMCEVRIVEVPAELHHRYRFAEKLPLYQMIGKNVGIRRARGQFVLATNIDILFSDELMHFIAQRSLEHDTMYRLDRYDVMSDVPVDAPVEEQLDYCRSHLIRVNTKDGTFKVSETGPRPLQPNDIAEPESGISFQSGWYEREIHRSRPFRWVNNDAIIRIDPTEKAAKTLAIELEPGPGVGWGPFTIKIQDSSLRVELRSIVTAPLKCSGKGPWEVRLQVEGGGERISSDLRTLNFKVFRCDLKKRAAKYPTVRPVLNPRSWAAHLLRSKSVALQPAGDPVPSPLELHTNGCGDFTMLARDHWMDLRGYPELDMFSMNIDSLFCCAAHFAGVRERVLDDPMRIYHIEHGSGWTPEADTAMYSRLEANGVPWLDYKDVLRWAGDMDRLQRPLIFNREDWGLANEVLKETNPIHS